MIRENGEKIAKLHTDSSSAREERVGRGLRRGEFHGKERLFSLSLSSI